MRTIGEPSCSRLPGVRYWNRQHYFVGGAICVVIIIFGNLRKDADLMVQEFATPSSSIQVDRTAHNVK